MTADLSGLPGSDRGGALEGVVVVELAQSLAGEFAGGLLADLGAIVVKVEPREGSPLRRRGPGIAGEDSLYFQSENRGKYSVLAELGDFTREPWLAKLLASADAVVEDLGPGRLESVGLSPDALFATNPRLAVLRISPFGQTGPLAGALGDDRIAQAYSGMQFATGFPDRPPIPVTVPLADAWSALLGTSALLMAIFHARRSGHGQVVDIGLYQAGLRMQEEAVIRHHRTGALATRMGTESPTVVPANVYPTRDGGWIALSGAGDQPFARLCEAIEAPEAVKDPRFATSAARLVPPPTSWSDPGSSSTTWPTWRRASSTRAWRAPRSARWTRSSPMLTCRRAGRCCVSSRRPGATSSLPPRHRGSRGRALGTP
jgi:crotonobetainyl-CoA:carnitine CoA-transferase CaiB-like acyl-CoA transferase